VTAPSERLSRLFALLLHLSRIPFLGVEHLLSIRMESQTEKYGTAETIASIVESADFIFGRAFASNFIGFSFTLLGLFFAETEVNNSLTAVNGC
jgi:hypothetical protein